MSSVYFDPAVGGDGSTVTDDNNPLTGLGAGGHRLRFVPSLFNAVNIAGFITTQANTIKGIAWQSVRAASTTNITLSAPQTIDGVSLIANDRVLVTGQTDPTFNGIYIVQAGSWIRATDANESGEFYPGKMLTVIEGTLSGDTVWIYANDSSITLGSSAITFIRQPSLSKVNTFTGVCNFSNLNATGGAINGTTVGASSASTGAFTTLAASGAFTGTTGDFSGAIAANGGALSTTASTFNLVNTNATTVNFAGASTALTLGAVTGTTTVRNALTVTGAITNTAGTANGVAYLNGSKVLTTGSALTFNGTSFGVGTATPSGKFNVNGAVNDVLQRFSIGGTSVLDVYDDGSAVRFSGRAGTGRSLAFDTNDITRLIIDPAGNLGLGLTPSAWRSGDRALDVGSNTALTDAQGSATRLYANTYVATGGVNTYKRTDFASYYDQSSGIHRFFTAPSGIAGNAITFTQAMTLTQGGNLLVGTTSDNGRKISAQVADSASFIDTALFTNGTNSNLNIAIRTNETIISNLANNGALLFSAGGATEAARITSGRYSKFSSDGTYNGSGAGYHEFRSTAAGASTLVLTRTQDTAAESNYLSLFNTTFVNAYHFEGRNNGTNVYRVLANGNVANTNGVYGTISDAKVKENVEDTSPKLDKLNQLRVVNFNRIGDDLRQIGFIAQEVQQVFPSLVDSSPDLIDVEKTRSVEVPAVLDEEGNELTPATIEEETYTEKEPNGEVTLSVKTSVLVPILVKAIQEQQAIIDQQKQQIDLILARLDLLENN